ncbi:MAG: helix-turn-helix domain-containing protein [Lachnospiraceae bacterium]|nr:helix-turn-helix domain-containing protein [Lachnospiraceae bacterium]
MKLYIKELREEKGYTQKELADLMQVSFQTISKWETGANYPDITHIPKLADIFGVSAGVLLGMEPLREEAPVKYDSEVYWNRKRDLLKVWKRLFWNEDYFRFLVKDVWKFQGPVDILDLGCGYGYLGSVFLPLLPKGSTYSGVELDGGQIEEAKEYFEGKPWDCTFYQEDLYEFKPEKQYDLVVTLFLMSHLPDPKRVLRLMKDALKPGGMILLIDANMEVEQAGYYSGLEREENGLPRPDLVPMWEYEAAHAQRDYRMGTKLPYLLKQEGFHDIQARISDQVVIYEPSDPAKQQRNEDLRFVYTHDDFYEEGTSYFLNRGLSLEKANEIREYFSRTTAYFDKPDSCAVKTSGVYFVYGKK